MMADFKRVVLVIVEGLGLGAAPDAAAFADNGSDTLGHLVEYFRARLQLPTLQRMGLAELHFLTDSPLLPEHSYYGRLRQLTNYKSAVEDYWELFGAVNQTEPTAYPAGFPAAFVRHLEQAFHRPVLVNAPYQPQHLLEDYGEMQAATGGLLVSTSGGSDLLISAHEATIADAELVRVGRFSRRFFDEAGPRSLQKVITVSFAGAPGRYYYRSAAQQVFYMQPAQPTVLDRAQAADCPVRVLAGAAAFDRVRLTLQDRAPGLYLVPVHEIDQAGYRRDPEASGQSLMEFDRQLAEILPLVHADDLLLVTANHGNDPVFSGNASTREWLPLLAYSPALQGGRLADRPTLADVAATIQDILGLGTSAAGVGRSFRSLLV